MTTLKQKRFIGKTELIIKWLLTAKNDYSVRQLVLLVVTGSKSIKMGVKS